MTWPLVLLPSSNEPVVLPGTGTAGMHTGLPPGWSAEIAHWSLLQVMTPVVTLRAQVQGLYTQGKKARRCGATRPAVSDRVENANIWLSRCTTSPAHLLATFTMPPPTVSQRGKGRLCYFNRERSHTDLAYGNACSLVPNAALHGGC